MVILHDRYDLHLQFLAGDGTLPDTFGLLGCNWSVKLVQSWQWSDALLEEDVPLKPPRKGSKCLVLDVPTRRHSEDVIEFLQCSLLGLGHEHEDQEECSDVQTCVEGECSHWMEGSQ